MTNSRIANHLLFWSATSFVVWFTFASIVAGRV